MAKNGYLTRLRAEVGDVCEVDRKHRAYELIFDDGSSVRVATVAEIRAEVARRRAAADQAQREALAFYLGFVLPAPTITENGDGSYTYVFEVQK